MQGKGQKEKEKVVDVVHVVQVVLVSAQQVGFFNIGSGWVLNKIPGSGSGSGGVRVSKNTIGYFRVSFFFPEFPGVSGISG